MAKRQSPTPTLAQLRKLAKQKGHSEIDICHVIWPLRYWKAFCLRDAPTAEGLKPCKEFFSVENGRREEVLRKLYKYLRALPDKGGPRG